jgi:tRNA(Glu) U13 pseudouridine synthase TruD
VKEEVAGEEDEEEKKEIEIEDEVMYDMAKKFELVFVTEENKHLYTIYDVVLPLVGYNTEMPKHEGMKDIIMEIMKEDSIT